MEGIQKLIDELDTLYADEQALRKEVGVTRALIGQKQDLLAAVFSQGVRTGERLVDLAIEIGSYSQAKLESLKQIESTMAEYVGQHVLVEYDDRLIPAAPRFRLWGAGSALYKQDARVLRVGKLESAELVVKDGLLHFPIPRYAQALVWFSSNRTVAPTVWQVVEQNLFYREPGARAPQTFAYQTLSDAKPLAKLMTLGDKAVEDQLTRYHAPKLPKVIEVLGKGRLPSAA